MLKWWEGFSSVLCPLLGEKPIQLRFWIEKRGFWLVEICAHKCIRPPMRRQKYCPKRSHYSIRWEQFEKINFFFAAFWSLTEMYTIENDGDDKDMEKRKERTRERRKMRASENVFCSFQTLRRKLNWNSKSESRLENV